MSAETRTSEDNNFRTRSKFVQSEFEEAAYFLQDVGLRGMFVFFGSARTRSQEQIDAICSSVDAELQSADLAPERKAALEAQRASALRKQWAVPLWNATRELSRLLTAWSLSEDGRSIGRRVWSLLPGGAGDSTPLMVCSGGGPGFMEAANLGARMVPGGKSIGLGVKLPFEANLNEYVDYGLTVHSFYVRKYWEVYAIKAMIVAPGGMGTLDEMFEVLTLMQCGHCPKIPVVLLGKEFFTTSINLKYLAEKDMISQHEVDSLCITDDPVEAFEFITEFLRKEADMRRLSAPTSPRRLEGGSPRLRPEARGPAPSTPLIPHTLKRDRDEEEAPASPAPPSVL